MENLGYNEDVKHISFNLANGALSVTEQWLAHDAVLARIPCDVCRIANAVQLPNWAGAAEIAPDKCAYIQLNTPRLLGDDRHNLISPEFCQGRVSSHQYSPALGAALKTTLTRETDQRWFHGFAHKLNIMRSSENELYQFRPASVGHIDSNTANKASK